MKQWKCSVCGRIFDGDEPPVPCPVCSAGESAFSEISGTTSKWRCTVCGQIFDGDAPPVPCPICSAGESAFVREAACESSFHRDTQDSFVLIGGGVASLEAARAIRLRNKTASIRLVCGEGVIPYNRPALSDVVGDGLSFEAIVLQEFDWYAQNNIELICDAKCEKIDREHKTVTLTDARELSYTKLLLATGANAFIPPVKTDGTVPIMALRKFSDASELFENAKNKAVLVVGGGILGIEAALALRERGCTVSVVELAAQIMSLQADSFMSARLTAALEKHGISIYSANGLDYIKNNTATLINAENISVELVLMCAGVRAEASLAKSAGLLTDRGIIINSTMQTSDNHIYAAGDCAQFDGKVFGLYSAAAASGQAAGAAIAGDEISFSPLTAATAFDGAGIVLFSAGDFNAPRGATLVYNNPEANIYQKLVYDGKALVGAVLSGEVSAAADIMGAIGARRGYTIKI